MLLMAIKTFYETKMIYPENRMTATFMAKTD